MIGEFLIWMVGFFRWIFKGCKTNLKEEINGSRTKEDGIRGRNYMIGVVVLFLIILIMILT